MGASMEAESPGQTKEAAPGPASSEGVSKGRLSWFRVLTVLFGVGAGLGLFGWISLVFGWFQTGTEQIHRVHNLGGSGVLIGILVSVPLLVQVRRPTRWVATMQQIFAVVVGTLVAAALALDTTMLLYAVIVGVPALILSLLHPSRAELFRWPGKPIAVLAAMTVVGAIPLGWFAWSQATIQRTKPLSTLPGPWTSPEHFDFHHYSGMAAMALALVLVGLVAAAGARGWRLSAWCAGLGAAAYGLASALFAKFPSTSAPYASSEGVGWGLAAIAGGALFILAAEWQARRGSASTAE